MDHVESPKRESKYRKLAPWAAPIGGLAGLVPGCLVVAAATRFADNPSYSYGFWLFCLTPLPMGFCAAHVARKISPDSSAAAAWAAVWSYLEIALGMLLFQREGLVCIAMAAPLYIPISLLGAAIANWIELSRHSRISVSVIPILMLATFWEAHRMPAAERREESTSIVIDAPPERVWPYVFNLDRVLGPTDPVLALGFAHPIATKSFGTSLGARRECILTTGVMPEVIDTVIPNRLLQFRVLDTPPSMIETNPFGPVHAAHLRGYYTCESGEFHLTPLPGGRTRLDGISRYSFRIYPVVYWSLWTDTIVERIHLSVMRTIKTLAERSSVKSTNPQTILEP